MFESILLLLIGVVIATLIFHPLKIPIILAYILVGILFGPQLLEVIPNSEDVRNLAEFGVVFLLFMIGLEFSLSKMIAMRKIVVYYGGLQVLLSIAITYFTGRWLGLDISEASVVGMLVAMSSTAIVCKQLTDQAEIYLKHGNNAVGILLLQDLAVIPCLILIPSLADVEQHGIYTDLIWAVGRGLIVIAAILFIGQRILRPMFHKIARTRSMELFTLTTILVTLSSAWITHASGLSLALGAFLAGMMLGETEFRHQIKLEVRPFRDILLGLFFITIGMQFTLQNLSETWYWIILLFAALVIFKLSLITLIGRLLGYNMQVSLRTGIVLAQGGEFGFAILMLALIYNIMPTDYSQVIIGALIFSMALSPFLIRYNREISNFLLPQTKNIASDELIQTTLEQAKDIKQHAIICGFGRVGQNIARLLQQEGLDYIAIDLDSNKVQKAILAGKNVTYGNASHHEILRAVGIDHARALVICINETNSVEQILKNIREINTKIPILIRSYDENELEYFRKLGATEIIPETLESSIVLGTHVLLMMGVPVRKVFRDQEKARRNRYQLLREVFPSDYLFDPQKTSISSEFLKIISIPSDSYAKQKTLAQLNLDDFSAKVINIRRQGKNISPKDIETKLQTGDILTVFGENEAMEKLENYLLTGE